MQILLLKLRKDNNLTQEDLSKLLGITTKSYGQKERGKMEFTQDEMFKLSKYFGKPMTEIFLPRDYQIGTLAVNWCIKK